MTQRKSHGGARAQGAPRNHQPMHTTGKPPSRWSDPNTWIALGTVALVLIGLGALWISRDSEEKQLRAYILVTDFGVACAPCGDTELKLPGFSAVKNALIMRIQNSGETPASHIKPTFNWWPVHRPATRLPAGFKFPDLGDRDSQNMNSSSELGKDEHGDAIGPLPQSAIATFEDAAPSGSDILFVYGHVDYCDVFGHPHSTAYCFEYERGLGDRLPKCGRFNGEIVPRGTCNR